MSEIKYVNLHAINAAVIDAIQRIGAIALVCWFLLVPSAIAQPTNLTLGEQVFTAQCAGCHINGGNIIRRGKTLKKAALERNGYNSVASIQEIVTKGKNNMSAYSDRLSPEEISAVSVYVLAKADANWK